MKQRPNASTPEQGNQREISRSRSPNEYVREKERLKITNATAGRLPTAKPSLKPRARFLRDGDRDRYNNNNDNHNSRQRVSCGMFRAENKNPSSEGLGAF